MNSGTNRKPVLFKQNSSRVSLTVSSGSVFLGSSGSDSGSAAELVSTAAADEGTVTSCKKNHTLKHTLPAFKTTQRPENDQLHYEACRINNILIKKKSWFKCCLIVTLGENGEGVLNLQWESDILAFSLLCSH